MYRAVSKMRGFFASLRMTISSFITATVKLLYLAEARAACWAASSSRMPFSARSSMAVS